MSKRQATGGHSKHGSLEDDVPDDEESTSGWGTRLPDVDRKTEASKEVMSSRKIAPLKGRRPGAAGPRSGSPAGNVNALGNIFGGSPQPQTNGVNGNTSFSTSFGQNQQQPQNNMFGSSQHTQSFPAPSNNTSNAFTFGASRQSQSPSPAPQQQASFSFPPQSGSSGGFTFSAGPSGNNPFANLNSQQSSQQSNIGSNMFGGSTSQFKFGASSGQANGSIFGASKPQGQQGSLFGQSQTEAPQQQPATSPTDGAMQISPPSTPAGKTGQGGQQQSSISQTLSQNQSQSQSSPAPSNGLFGASRDTPKSSFGLFSPQPQQQSQDSQSKPSQAPLFGQNLDPKKTQEQKEASTPSAQTQTPLFGSAFGQKQQEQQKSFTENQQPQTSLFGQPFGQKQQEQSSSTTKPSQSTNPFESLKTPPQPSSQPPPATAPPKPSFNFFQPSTGTASTPSKSDASPSQSPQTEPRPGPQNNIFGQSAGQFSTIFGSTQKTDDSTQRQQDLQIKGQSSFSAETPESFSDEQKEEYEKQKKIVSLNRSFVNMLEQTDVAQDQSAMMQAYLSEIGKIKTAVAATQQSFQPQADTSNVNNKRKADVSTSEAPPSKKPASEASEPSAPSIFQAASSVQAAPPTPAAPSPQRSQTASLFSNIVGSSSHAPQPQQPSDAPQETPRPANSFGSFQQTRSTPQSTSAPQTGNSSPPESPNPFAGLKKWTPPQQQCSSLFAPKPQERSAPSSNMFGASTSSNIFTPKPAPARSMSPEKSASAARSLFERSSSPSKSPEKDILSSTPVAPTPSPFTNSSSAQTPHISNSQGALHMVPTFGNPFIPSTKRTADKEASPAPSIPAPPTFSVPKFGAGAGTNFLSQFGQAAKKTEEAERKKRKAEDFDSDEDDEAEWERRDAEKQVEKKRKVEEETKKAPKFTFSGTPTSSRESSQGSSAAPNSFGGSNIFAHLADTSKAGSVPSDAGEDQASSDDGEREEGEQSESTRESGQARDASEAPSEQTPESGASQGKSLFDRITPAGAAEKDSESSETPKKNPFASSNGVSNGLFSSKSSPAGDNTWKPDSPLKFGDGGSSASSAPTFKFTPSTPSGGMDGASDAKLQPKTPMPNLFGSPAPNPTPSLFGTAAKPQFSFGGLPKGNSLLSSARANDDNASNTSRGTSPALSATGTDADGESVNGTGDEGGDAEVAKDEQVDLTGVPEDEEIVFEKEQVKAMENEEKIWKTRGVGILRLLKNKDTGIYSVLLRQTPGGKVVINTRLQKELQYKDAGKGKVTLSIPKATKEGLRIASWFLNFSQKCSSEAAKFVELTEGAKEDM